MLHKIVMVGLVLLGLVTAGLSVASGTLWRPSDTAVMSSGSQSGATLMTTAPGVLGLVDDSVSITATSSPGATVVLVVGRTVDVDGWIGEDPALVVTGASDWDTLAVTLGTGGQTVAPTDAATDPAATDEPPADDPADPDGEATEETPTDEAPADDAAADEAPTDEAPTDEAPADDAAAADQPGPDPSVSDMWVRTVTGQGTASLDWTQTSSDEVLLVAAVGPDAATPTLTLTWPREVTTPWMWPGTALGALLVVLGLVYGAVLVRGRRRSAVATTSGGTETSDDEPTAGLTRRQLRERAARAEAEVQAQGLAEGDAPASKPKRQWPWTGAIPVVVAEDTAEPAATPAEDPKRPAWLPEGTATTSASSWRQAWGVRPESAVPATEDDSATPRTDGAAGDVSRFSAPSTSAPSTPAPGTSAGSGSTGAGSAPAGSAPAASSPADAAPSGAERPEAARPEPVRPARPAGTWPAARLQLGQTPGQTTGSRVGWSGTAPGGTPLRSAPAVPPSSPSAPAPATSAPAAPAVRPSAPQSPEAPAPVTPAAPDDRPLTRRALRATRPSAAPAVDLFGAGAQQARAEASAAAAAQGTATGTAPGAPAAPDAAAADATPGTPQPRTPQPRTPRPGAAAGTTSTPSWSPWRQTRPADTEASSTEPSTDSAEPSAETPKDGE